MVLLLTQLALDHEVQGSIPATLHSYFRRAYFAQCQCSKDKLNEVINELNTQCVDQKFVPAEASSSRFAKKTLKRTRTVKTFMVLSFLWTAELWDWRNFGVSDNFTDQSKTNPAWQKCNIFCFFERNHHPRCSCERKKSRGVKNFQLYWLISIPIYSRLKWTFLLKLRILSFIHLKLHG